MWWIWPQTPLKISFFKGATYCPAECSTVNSQSWQTKFFKGCSRFLGQSPMHIHIFYYFNIKNFHVFLILVGNKKKAPKFAFLYVGHSPKYPCFFLILLLAFLPQTAILECYFGIAWFKNICMYVWLHMLRW